MSNSDWRQRLEEAIAESGKSMRSISIASGNGPGYVHSIIVEGKDPTISNLIAVCDTIPTSIIYILHGHDVTPEDAEILDLLHRHPDKRSAIQSLISSK
ncbi:hypothetical protein GCM10016455_05790 [Aliiroseovarius zhejiangensis]|uniref:XRE family transcriptional regulator n=1 Tax=Aliiroseovarius zhejiangensis TaxID=1632025 RepID=A0ABQ3IMD9_9RHOB|nr:XRE family transcriptional regulator [Aliiroseovarius zhejiangensis]GHE88501.1 hypothetical protein GCM10016455_05790 [Aliiroseovarius zhejiangensis]